MLVVRLSLGFRIVRDSAVSSSNRFGYP
ncbi:hypothetical protein A2U01_0068867, partial [Trifolium medium]|nr:hypothetical protein [Trifolium medium]